MVTKPDQLQTKTFWVAAGWRALRTFAQSLLTVLGVDATQLLNADALAVLVTGLVAGLISILTSIVFGIPEAPKPDLTGPPETITDTGITETTTSETGETL